MFLSDQLKQIVDKTDIAIERNVLDSLKEMIRLCFAHISEQTSNPAADDRTLIAAFQRCNLIWKQTHKYAKSINKAFFIENGFENFVKGEEKFKEIHHLI